MRDVLIAFILFSLTLQVSAVPEWGQCGGEAFTGSTICDASLTCIYVNYVYSQCQRSASSTATSPAEITSGTSGSLASRIVAKGKKYFGTAADAITLSVPQNDAIIRAQFNQLTPLESMKWDTTEPTKGTFNFAKGNTLVNYAQANGMIIRGHNLIWHSQIPSWVTSINNPATLTSVIQNHITTEVGEWKGKIYAWDVCNEILNEQGSFRTTFFYNVLGQDFVNIAFAAARSADPGAKLYINDYNMESASYAKTIGMISIVKSFLAAGVPIDGIGSESHLSPGRASTIQGALSALAGSGVSEIAMTELDIADSSPSEYSTAVKACLAVSACVGITVWGVSDKDSWRTSRAPLLFDRDYQPKPAYTAVMSALA